MRSFRVTVDGVEYDVVVDPEKRHSINGTIVQADIHKISEQHYAVLIDGQSISVLVTGKSGAYHVVIDSLGHEVTVETERQRLLRSFGTAAGTTSRRSELRAPMPALIVRIEVEQGERVEEGHGLIVLEAMKMENELKAIASGTIRELCVKKGMAVEKGDLLMIIE